MIGRINKYGTGWQSGELLRDLLITAGLTLTKLRRESTRYSGVSS